MSIRFAHLQILVVYTTAAQSISIDTFNCKRDRSLHTTKILCSICQGANVKTATIIRAFDRKSFKYTESTLTSQVRRHAASTKRKSSSNKHFLLKLRAATVNLLDH